MLDADWLAESLAYWEAHDFGGRNVKRSRRYRLWERDGGCCGICGAPVAFEDTETDHIVPWADGGRTVPSNLRAVHRACNRARLAERCCPNGRGHCCRQRNKHAHARAARPVP